MWDIKIFVRNLYILQICMSGNIMGNSISLLYVFSTLLCVKQYNERMDFWDSRGNSVVFRYGEWTRQYWECSQTLGERSSEREETGVREMVGRSGPKDWEGTGRTVLETFMRRDRPSGEGRDSFTDRRGSVTGWSRCVVGGGFVSTGTGTGQPFAGTTSWAEEHKIPVLSP